MARAGTKPGHRLRGTHDGTKAFLAGRLTLDAGSGLSPAVLSSLAGMVDKLLLDIEERPLHITWKVDQNDPEGLFQPRKGRRLESRSIQSLNIC